MVTNFNARINSSQRQPPWYDNECRVLKANKYSLLRQFRNIGNLDILAEFKEVKKKFKAMCRCKKKTFHENQRSNLVAALPNAKLFWGRSVNLRSTIFPEGRISLPINGMATLAIYLPKMLF